LVATAASGVARFDHDPVTGKCLGLLMEEARTNFLLNSADANFNGVTGTTNATYTTATTLAPDNTSSVKFLQETTATGYHRVDCYSGGGTGSTVSVFVKPAGRYRFRFLLSGTSGSGAIFNTQTGTISYSGNAGNGRIDTYSNGWYRLSVGIPTAGDNRQDGSYFSLLDNSGAESYTGDGTSGAYLWGCQAEIGSFPTSYIPTTSATVTRAADVATLANTNSSIFPTSAFTIVNSPYGTAGGSSTLKLVGPTIKRTAVYNGDLTQTQINTLAGVNDNFWRWRVLGSSFALPSFTTDGSVTVDWGDGTIETLTTGAHTFTNGGGYHDIGFRLNSGTYFRPYINGNSTYSPRVIAVGPAPASMKVNADRVFFSCTALKSFDATVDASGGTSFFAAWYNCSNLTSFPLINTAAGTDFGSAWNSCTGLTSFPLINTAAGTSFSYAWYGCSSLTSFPLINTAAGTSFYYAWYGCSNLTSFPLITTAAGTDFSYAWLGCSSLTSFPLINTAAAISFYQTWNGCFGLTSFPLISTGTVIGFQQAWLNCSGLTSFPLINTAAGTTFYQTWRNCSSLTSFPLINTGSGTNFEEAWRNCSSLTSFPLINTAAGTSFYYAWYACSSLTSFPLINTGSGTNFEEAWAGCSSLTSFPLINTAAGTNFSFTWYRCTSLTSFPLINTAAGTNFTYTWQQCTSLTSFPLINTAAGIGFDYAWQGCTSLTSFPSLSFASATSFYQAWYGCTSLTTFPANRFDTTGTLAAGAFSFAFRTCALTAASIENILTSLVTNGRSNITLDLDGGTNAGASTWTANAVTAYNTLISRGWSITRNA
jgi:hypothetical protein